jgi:hypothetical protein
MSATPGAGYSLIDLLRAGSGARICQTRTTEAVSIDRKDDHALVHAEPDRTRRAAA